MKFIFTLYVYLFLSILTKLNCNETVEYKTEKLHSNIESDTNLSAMSNLKTQDKKTEIKANTAKTNNKVMNTANANKVNVDSTNAANLATAVSLESSATAKPHKREIEKKQLTPINMNLVLPEADIYFQGWCRYYHYSIMQKSHITKPKLFFQNDHYYSQRIRKPKHKKTDKYGSLAIPNKAAFFLVLYNKTISMYSSREDTILRQADSLSMNLIDIIPEDNLAKGAVRDMGNFPTGNCIEIKAKIPLKIGGPRILNYWIVCFDDGKEANIFKKMLIKVKIRQQRSEEIVPFTVDSLHKKDSIGAAIKGKPVVDPSNTSPKNGYWMLLQDWTDCTLSCGGGFHYQQWMCVPPKRGGIDCQGDSIRRRACNTQPCPNAHEVLERKNLDLQHLPKIYKPTIKIGRFSARPQRYSKCLIKENDAFITEWDRVTLKVKKKIPVRVVMNNRTITVFQDDDYSDMLKTFQLKSSYLMNSEKFCCFGIRDNEKELRLCGYPENCGDRSKNGWVDQWKEDFNLFRTVCRVGMQETMLTADDMNRLNGTDLMDPLGIDIDAVRRRKQQLRDDINLDNDKMYKKNILQTQELGFKAIEREFNIENMIKKEEKAKEDSEMLDIEDQIKKEEKKASCIKKQIEEKDLDDDWDDKLEADEEMDRLKKKINMKIELGRNRVKKLLADMRKKAKLRRQDLLQRLQAVRAKMAHDILLTEREGHIPPCLKGKTDTDFRENYCNSNFVEDYVNNSACKSADDFCYTCCEHEFGNNYRMKRSQCYRACDGLDKKNAAVGPKKENRQNPGEWVWAAEHQVK